MLDKKSNFEEAQFNRVVFKNMKYAKIPPPPPPPPLFFFPRNSNQCGGWGFSGVVLEKVCEYFYYREKYKDAVDVPDMDIPPELALELLMVADFLYT